MPRRLVAVAVMTLAMTGLATVVATTGALADQKTVTFTVTLSGSEEVCPTDPGSCGGPGTGIAVITVDRKAGTVCYRITTENVELPLLSAHIHLAPAGEAGPPVVTLFGSAINSPTVGPTCVTDVDKSLLKDIIRNPENYYINVHNAQFPNGALRGQLA